MQVDTPLHYLWTTCGPSRDNEHSSIRFPPKAIPSANDPMRTHLVFEGMMWRQAPEQCCTEMAHHRLNDIEPS